MHFAMAQQISDWTHAAVALPSGLDSLYSRLVFNRVIFFHGGREKNNPLFSGNWNTAIPFVCSPFTDLEIPKLTFLI